MKCHNCGFEIKSNICPKCNTDNVLNRRIVGISDMLYNKGLEQAKDCHYYEAICSLNKSLQFNKRNCDARNVLGLVYFVTGRVGDAIRQWVLSLNVSKENNPARTYISEMEKNAAYMEKLDDSIKMYNQALTYVAQKSEDIAIIQLKKAIDLNPSFVDGLNLLSLCYIIAQDSRKAMSCIERVLAIDSNNPMAINYFAYLNPDKPRTSARPKAEGTPEPRQLQRSVSSGSGLRDRKTFGAGFPLVSIIMWFLIGSICSFAIIYILLMPSAISAKDAQITQLTSDYTAKETEYLNSINSLEEKFETASGKLETVEGENNALSSEVEKHVRTQNVLKADIALRDGDAQAAVDFLVNFNPNGLPEDIINSYNSVKESAYGIIEKQAYDEGLRLYNQKKYADAAPYFQKSITYTTMDSKTVGNSYYYLGAIAERDQDVNSAKTYYEKVVNDYKDFTAQNLYRNAENQLNRLNQS